MFFLVICFAAAFQASTAFAEEESVKAEIADTQTRIKEAENVIASLEKEKAQKSEELVKADYELQEVRESIEALEISIDENSKILEDARAETEESFKSFSERLMSMYEQGSNAYISLILGAENISDVIRRVNMISEISTHDREVYQAYKDNKTVIETKQSELNSEKEELEQRTSEFEAGISEKNGELEKIVSELNSNRKQLSELREKERSLKLSLSSVDYADKLFAEAEKYLGMPYVFGGSTPETSFDCSGFVCYSVTHSGVMSLPRTTAQGIYNQCVKISASEAKRGDIIFFQGTYDAGETVTHVGFYAGDGKMLHCGNPIQYTSTRSPYWQSHFYSYGRLKK